MASITSILATDSLSSSRIVLNDNFAAINDELNDIAEVLDPQAQTLTLTGVIGAAGLNIINGGNLFIVNSTDIIASVPVTTEDLLILEGGMLHSISSGITALPAVNAYDRTTYVIDATAFTGAQVINAALNGQTVTFISDGGDFSVNPSNIAGATEVTIHDNGALTLRYSTAASLWYVISAVNVELVF